MVRGRLIPVSDGWTGVPLTTQDHKRRAAALATQGTFYRFEESVLWCETTDKVRFDAIYQWVLTGEGERPE